MIKRIHVKSINGKAEYKATGFLTREETTATMDRMVDQVGCNMEHPGIRFPSSATRNQTYRAIGGIEWTDGSWTGLLWLCYRYTGDDASKNLALKNVDSLLNRVERRTELSHHDPGSLYSLSCVTGYKLTGSVEGRKAGFPAADKLMKRFQEEGGFIQIWGELGARDSYHLIVNYLLSIPLLYQAPPETGNPVYRNATAWHYEAVCNNVIRDDASVYHTSYFDPETGEPLKGVTRRGYSGDSAWVRGQAWRIYGIPLNCRYAKDDSTLNLFKGTTNYFLNRLPEDEVCYWDLISTDDSNQSRDSSAAVVRICGIHEMFKYLPEVESDKNTHRHVIHRILCSPTERYTVPEIRLGNPVLLHGAYSWHSNKGADEGNIWGDYYYMEAPMRFYKDWNLY